MPKPSSPRLRYMAYALCLIVCPAKLVAFALGGSAVAGAFATLDYRIPLILAGWACIGLATVMMLRAKRDLATPARCKFQSSKD